MLYKQSNERDNMLIDNKGNIVVAPKLFANGEERAAFLAPLREVLAVKSCKGAKGFSLQERAEQHLK